MLHGKLIQPTILHALGMAGHGSKVLIADGNYPFMTGSNPQAQHVFLNLTPGVVTVTQVLETLVGTIPLEAAEVMVPDSGPEPAIFAEFQHLLPANLTLTALERFEFYDAAKQPAVALVIATAEQRVYANLLLTIGVIPPS